MYDKFKAYIVPAISYDEYLGNALQFELDDEAQNLFSEQHSYDINLKFNSYEEAYSKKYNRKVTVDFWLSYAFSQPPGWMKSQVDDFKDKGQASAYVWVFDAVSGKRLDVVKLPSKPLQQLIEALKAFLRNDLTIGGEGGPPEEPRPWSPTSQPVEEEELVHASKLVKSICKFAR